MWAVTSLVVGNVIGSSIFLLPSVLAPYGGLAIVSWLITSAGAILLALVFARLASQVPRAGGPYVYTRVGFGDFAGFLIALGTLTLPDQVWPRFADTAMDEPPPTATTISGPASAGVAGSTKPPSP